MCVARDNIGLIEEGKVATKIERRIAREARGLGVRIRRNKK